MLSREGLIGRFPRCFGTAADTPFSFNDLFDGLEAYKVDVLKSSNILTSIIPLLC